jgi:hypothetical protein
MLQLHRAYDGDIWGHEEEKCIQYRRDETRREEKTETNLHTGTPKTVPPQFPLSCLSAAHAGDSSLVRVGARRRRCDAFPVSHMSGAGTREGFGHVALGGRDGTGLSTVELYSRRTIGPPLVSLKEFAN